VAKGVGNCGPDRGAAMEARDSKNKQAAGISPRRKAKRVEPDDGLGGGGGAAAWVIASGDRRESD
jgi:hypothetical protein